MLEIISFITYIEIYKIINDILHNRKNNTQKR